MRSDNKSILVFDKEPRYVLESPECQLVINLQNLIRVLIYSQVIVYFFQLLKISY
jgi:hypothetical protein